MRLFASRPVVLSCTVGALLLLGSCENPVCACSQSPAQVIVNTSLRTAADAPAAGRRLRAETSIGSSCTTYSSYPQSRVTDAEGRASFAATSFREDSVCVRFYASDSASGSPETLLPDSIKVLTSLYPFDTVQVALILPP